MSAIFVPYPSKVRDARARFSQATQPGRRRGSRPAIFDQPCLTRPGPHKTGEMASQLGPLPGGIERLVDHLANLAAGALARQLQIQRNNPEQIVKVVRYLASRTAIRLDLLDR